MTRLALTLSLCLLPTLVSAQDAESKPPAAESVAKALRQLKAAKQLTRLTQTRHYVMRRRSEVFALELGGEVKGDGLKLWLRVKRFSRAGGIELSYQLDGAGQLTELAMEELRYPGTKRERRQGFKGAIGGGKLSGTKVRDGQPQGKPFEMPWSDQNLPAIFMWFVVPSLFDQGLPQELEAEVVIEEKIRPGRKFERLRLVRTSAKPFKNKTGVLVHTFEAKNKNDGATVAVVAEGAQKGQVLQVTIGKSRSFDLISAKEYAQLLKDAPLIANEGKAQSILRSLRYAQETHQRKHGKFAASLDPLEQQDSYLAKRIEEQQAAYLVLLRASPDGSKWMAIAVPAEPGKTGKRYFVVNQDGKVHASTKKLELDESCAIPGHAKPVD